MDFSGKNRCGSGGEGAEEEGAAIWAWCFAVPHISPVVLEALVEWMGACGSARG
jgi:hypothetical protein